MPDRPDIKVIDLDGPEIPFHVLEVLVCPHDARCVRKAGGHRGADHVNPVEGSLGCYLLLVAAEAESATGDLPREMLPDLMLPDGFPDPDPDLVRVFRRPPSLTS